MSTDQELLAPEARHVRRPSRLPRHRLALLAVPMGLVLSGLVVWQSSYAAFVAQTGNSGNSWSTGTVTLQDDDSSQALFNIGEGPLVPGSSGSRCIAVTYTGTLPTASGGIRMYGARTGDATLASALTLKVELGSGSGFTDVTCSGFVPGSTLYDGTLGGFATAHSSYGTGATSGAWVPVQGETKAYRITYSLPNDRDYDTTYQGKTVGMTFTWEAQSAVVP